LEENICKEKPKKEFVEEKFSDDDCVELLEKAMVK